eukprot:gnl/Trimastix_PCT/2053.p1 GENE.gnl/Trimastix_PCT/2053~~gnl/Trimastix_PCT/2053.p1  ORF type:complete len:602 (+),score=27.41 gnl/Trimastix_PCT/2053:25-1806(+)
MDVFTTLFFCCLLLGSANCIDIRYSFASSTVNSPHSWITPEGHRNTYETFRIDNVTESTCLHVIGQCDLFMIGFWMILHRNSAPDVTNPLKNAYYSSHSGSSAPFAPTLSELVCLEPAQYYTISVSGHNYWKGVFALNFIAPEFTGEFHGNQTGYTPLHARWPEPSVCQMAPGLSSMALYSWTAPRTEFIDVVVARSGHLSSGIALFEGHVPSLPVHNPLNICSCFPPRAFRGQAKGPYCDYLPLEAQEGRRYTVYFTGQGKYGVYTRPTQIRRFGSGQDVTVPKQCSNEHACPKGKMWHFQKVDISAYTIPYHAALVSSGTLPGGQSSPHTHILYARNNTPPYYHHCKRLIGCNHQTLAWTHFHPEQHDNTLTVVTVTDNLHTVTRPFVISGADPNRFLPEQPQIYNASLVRMHEARIDWYPVPDAQSFMIQSRSNEGYIEIESCPWADVDTPWVPSMGNHYVDRRMKCNTVYQYRVCPVNHAGKGTCSASTAALRMPSEGRCVSNLDCRAQGGQGTCGSSSRCHCAPPYFGTYCRGNVLLHIALPAGALLLVLAVAALCLCVCCRRRCLARRAEGAEGHSELYRDLLSSAK